MEPRPDPATGPAELATGTCFSAWNLLEWECYTSRVVHPKNKHSQLYSGPGPPTTNIPLDGFAFCFSSLFKLPGAPPKDGVFFIGQGDFSFLGTGPQLPSVLVTDLVAGDMPFPRYTGASRCPENLIEVPSSGSRHLEVTRDQLLFYPEARESWEVGLLTRNSQWVTLPRMLAKLEAANAFWRRPQCHVTWQQAVVPD